MPTGREPRHARRPPRVAICPDPTLAIDNIGISVENSARLKNQHTAALSLWSIDHMAKTSPTDDLSRRERQVMEIHESNGWIKVIDALLGEVPILGMFTGYFLHPAYDISRVGGQPVARHEKQPAFFEGIFDLNLAGPVDPAEETLILLSVMTMTLLERGRG